MSQKERDRLRVLHEVKMGHLTQKQAVGQLKLSERWVRKLLARVRKEGDGRILHRLRGRASKRKLSATVPSGTVSQKGHREERGDPANSGGGLPDSRAPSWGLISRLGRGLLSVVPSHSCAPGLSMSKLAPT